MHKLQLLWTGLIFSMGLLPLSAQGFFTDVQVRYEEAQTFKRISEYFTGVENQGRRLIVRQPAEERAGLYWVIHTGVPISELSEGAQLRVSFFRLGSADVETRTYPLPTDRRVNTLFAGITGADWTRDDKLPTAWKLELLDSRGEILDARESYLWQYP